MSHYLFSVKAVIILPNRRLSSWTSSLLKEEAMATFEMHHLVQV